MTTIHHAIPLFPESEPILQPERNHDLLYAIVILTGKLSDFTFKFISDAELDDQIEFLLSSGALQEDLIGSSPTLEELRKACLFSFYEFHQFPGQQAWMRINKLVRIAYWIGLDQFDNHQRPRACYHPAMNPEDALAWRLLWWCVYRLDSYANLAAGTPYGIEEEIMNVCLLGDVDAASSSSPGSDTSQVGIPFTSKRLGDLWKSVPRITPCSDEMAMFNYHILTVTALRQVGRGLRRLTLSSAQVHVNEPTVLDQQISTLHLALPEHHLNPARNVLRDETPICHHQRLTNILHTHMAKLLISIMRCKHHSGAEDWLLLWQAIVENSQDMAAFAGSWSTAFILQIDPALCFILFTALIFTYLQRRSQFASVASIARLESQERALLLLLEHFGHRWTQPRMLIRK